MALLSQHIKRVHIDEKELGVEAEASGLIAGPFVVGPDLNSENESKVEGGEKPLVVDKKGEIVTNEKPVNETFPCDLFNFKSVANTTDTRGAMGHITKHKKVAHGVEPSPRSCDQCNYTTLSVTHLNRHKEAKHETGKARIPCSLCDHTFKSKDAVTKHISTVHNPIDYPCPKCDYEAKSVDTLKYHFELQHDGQIHTCDVCSLEFKTKKHINNHKKVIHEQLRFPCEDDLCDYKAKDQSSLTYHRRSCHEGIRYTCYYCKLNYSKVTSLTSHVKSKHPVKL